MEGNWERTIKGSRYSFIPHKLLRTLDISVTEYAFLDIITRYSEPLTRQRLSKFLGVTERTITNIYKKMTKMGLINQDKRISDKFLNLYLDEAQKGNTFTKLDFKEAEKLKLRHEEFCILDSIYFFIRMREGSCYESKLKLALVINQKERSVFYILNHLESLGLIKRDLKKIYPQPHILQLFIQLRKSKDKLNF